MSTAVQAVLDLERCGDVPQGGGPPEGHRCGGEPLSQLLPAFLGWFTQHYDWHYPSQDASPAGKGLAPPPRSGARGTVVPRQRRD